MVEESADTIYLVLPSASALGDQGGELSDQELEAVAGEVGGNFRWMCLYPVSRYRRHGKPMKGEARWES